ncbi:MAG: hypothetical protein AAF514_21260, partial [Verrucomicrobiota bacterium]
QLHCESNLSFSEVVGERVISGNHYPIVSSHLFEAPFRVQPGHTFLIEGIGEASNSTDKSKDELITVLITPSRVPAGSQAVFE